MKNTPKLTLASRVRDLYANPVGHDALAKVLMQLGLSEAVLKNPVVGGMTLRRLAALASAKLQPDFWMSLLRLVMIANRRRD